MNSSIVSTPLSVTQLEDRWSPALLTGLSNVIILPPPGEPVVISPVPPAPPTVPGTQSQSQNGGYA